MKRGRNSRELYLPATMKDREFQRFSAAIYDLVGIKMPPEKKLMLEGRLQKRLKALGIATFEAYGEFVFNPKGDDSELIRLIDVVTTNKTDFFREPAHFELLIKRVLPELLRVGRDLRSDPLKIWSAGCSTGEEPYTIAMVLSEFAHGHPGFAASVVASDVCTDVLKSAKMGIYPEDRTDAIPLNLKKKYLLKSRDKTKGLVRFSPKLRSLVRFCRINFMDDSFGLKEKMDIIFCRNVVIYFDTQTRQELMQKFYSQLRDGGFLFIGHSESLKDLDVDFEQVALTVYQKL